ncbi:DsbA family protein [Stappia sp.]|uniref:DsbA family protein n=1 Tax=Stappia sp. TaxID=1870903 RepID=UPI003A991640
MKKLLLATIAAMTFVFSPLAQAQDTPLTRGDVEKIVREYLIGNPEIIREAFQELERREMAAASKARTEALSGIADILFNSTRQVELGNPDGDVTLVEFFDYNCGYCKRAMADMEKLLEEDKKLRVVLKEFPVLGQGSVEAAQVAVAVNMAEPEKYHDFHRNLMGASGQANKASALAAAGEAGLDVDKLEASLDDAEVKTSIQEVYMLANRLGLTGTPSYVIGDDVVMGAVGYDQLKGKIDSMRNCGQATC